MGVSSLMTLCFPELKNLPPALASCFLNGGSQVQWDMTCPWRYAVFLPDRFGMALMFMIVPGLIWIPRHLAGLRGSGVDLLRARFNHALPVRSTLIIPISYLLVPLRFPSEILILFSTLDVCHIR